MLSVRIQERLKRDASAAVPADLDHRVRTQLRHGRLLARPFASPSVAVSLAIAALVGLIAVVGLPVVMLYLTICTLATLPLMLHRRRHDARNRSLS